VPTRFHFSLVNRVGPTGNQGNGPETLTLSKKTQGQMFPQSRDRQNKMFCILTSSRHFAF